MEKTTVVTSSNVNKPLVITLHLSILGGVLAILFPRLFSFPLNGSAHSLIYRSPLTLSNPQCPPALKHRVRVRFPCPQEKHGAKGITQKSLSLPFYKRTWSCPSRCLGHRASSCVPPKDYGGQVASTYAKALVDKPTYAPLRQPPTPRLRRSRGSGGQEASVGKHRA